MGEAERRDEAERKAAERIKAVERRESKKIELTFLRRCATLSKDCEKQNSVEKQGWRE